MFWFYICFLISFKSFNVLIFFFLHFSCMFGRRWVLSGPPWWQNILGQRPTPLKWCWLLSSLTFFVLDLLSFSLSTFSADRALQCPKIMCFFVTFAFGGGSLHSYYTNYCNSCRYSKGVLQSRNWYSRAVLKDSRISRD